MSFMNNRNHYGWLVILLHWLLFLLIVGLVASGKYSHSLPREEKISELIFYHKQVGVAVLLLMMFRLLWRLVNTSVQPLVEGFLLRSAAFLTHWLLYLVVMAQAVVGITMSQAAGNEVKLFGAVLPELGGELGLLTEHVSEVFADGRMLFTWHSYGAIAIGVLVAIHLIAALTHHFYWSDDTLRRMWFGYRAPYEKGPKISGL